MHKLFAVLALAVGIGVAASIGIHNGWVAADALQPPPQAQVSASALVPQMDSWALMLPTQLVGTEGYLQQLKAREAGINGLLKHVEIAFSRTKVRRDFDALVAMGPSRSGGYKRYLNLNLRVPSGFTEAQYSAVLGHTALAPLIKSAVKMEAELGVNSLYILAHAAEESKWGKSPLVKSKNNYFGYNALDRDPNLAKRFKSPEACVRSVMTDVYANYLTPTGKYYSERYGATLMGMNQRYASNPNWAQNIAQIMYQLHTAID